MSEPYVMGRLRPVIHFTKSLTAPWWSYVVFPSEAVTK
jgi:hypothetical protein